MRSLWRVMIAAMAVTGCASVAVSPPVQAPHVNPPGLGLYRAKIDLGLDFPRSVQTLPAPASWDTVMVKVYSPRLKAPLVSPPLSTSAATLSLSFEVPVGSASIEAALFHGGASGSMLASGSTTLDLTAGPNTATISINPTGATLGVLVGSGGTGSSPDGDLAANALLNAPSGVAAHPSGLLFVERGNHRVRMVPKVTGSYFGVAMSAYQVYTVAGIGTSGFTGDGGAATSAKLQGPTALALDASGSLYIADTTNNRIRKVTPAGEISTVAGNGVAGGSANGYPATSAQLNASQGLALDASGSLFIADTGNNSIRMVPSVAGTYFGIDMAAGAMYTIAGDGSLGSIGDGEAAVSARLNQPRGVALDDGGHLFIADTGNHRIRMVASVAGSFYGQAMAAHSIYSIAGTGAADFGGDNGSATSANLNTPSALAFDANWNLLIADSLNHRIRMVDGLGKISTLAGSASGTENGFSTVHGKFTFPRGLAVTPAGHVLIADLDNHQIRVFLPWTGGL